MQAPAALISQMDPPPGERDAFDEWYRGEHVPARMRIPGFLGAVRAWAVQGEPSHLVVYYMRSLDVLEQPQYVELKANPGARTDYMLSHVAAFTRMTAVEIGDTGEAPPARYLYLVTFEVPAEAQEEFDAWYAEDHVPSVMRNEHWLRVRRYAVQSGAVPAGVTRAAVHELADVVALDSPERAEARASEWRARLAENEWFKTARYAVYERYQDFTGEHRRPDG
jgi:hypothetical protein